MLMIKEQVGLEHSSSADVEQGLYTVLQDSLCHEDEGT